MVPHSYAMDSQTKSHDLASLILSSSSPSQISTACAAIESFLHEHTADQTRCFFSIAFPALICKIFGFDDASSQKSRSSSPSSSGWIDQIHSSNDADLAGKVYRLLSPSGVLLSLISSVDRQSLVKYVFPVERLPEWARFMLQSERDCSVLSDLCPLFKSRVKEDSIQGSYQLQLNVFEYYVFWFAYYPVCKGNNENSDAVVVRKNRRFRLENWTSSLPVLTSGNRRLGHKIECSLYMRLLYTYLCAFVPNYGSNVCQPYRSSLLHYSSAYEGSNLLQAEFLVYALIHFWLVDNDFSPLPVSMCRSFGLTFPFRAVLGEIPPTAGLGEVVKVLVKYMNSNLVAHKDGHDLNVAKSRASVSLASPFPCGSSVDSWNLLMQRPLYRYILRTFLFCPMGTSIKNASQVFSLWISYMEPWKIGSDDFVELASLEDQLSENSRKENSWSKINKYLKDEVQSDSVYSPLWQGYVVSNYLFYSSLVVHFLGFAHKFLHANAETITQMVLKVLNILTSSKELMFLLKKVDAAYCSKSVGSSSPMFDGSYKCVPSIREQLQDWEDGLCENDADGSFLHENWNSELRLFTDGEDGGHQLLQLFILRAEHEVQAISGDNLAQNLQYIDALKAQMSYLFGGFAGKLRFSPEPMQSSRDEMFTPKHPGVGKRTWADVKYKGDWMRRPISDGEVAWLARLFVWFSDWLNEVLGLNQIESSQLVDPAWSHVEVPADGLVGGPKEAVWMMLASFGSWFVFLGQMVVRFMREHGLRMNLRVLASKKVVMVFLVYAVVSVLKRALGLGSHSLFFGVSF